MTVEAYIKAMAERGIDREGLEHKVKPFYQCHPSEWRQGRLLPGGEHKSMVPVKPPTGEDLSALNPSNKQTAQKAGKRFGRPRKTL